VVCALFEAEGLALEEHDVGVVGEPIQQRTGQRGVTEDIMMPSLVTVLLV